MYSRRRAAKRRPPRDWGMGRSVNSFSLPVLFRSASKHFSNIHTSAFYAHRKIPCSALGVKTACFPVDSLFNQNELLLSRLRWVWYKATTASLSHRSVPLVLNEDHGLCITGALVHALLHHVHRRGGELITLPSSPDYRSRGGFQREAIALVCMCVRVCSYFASTTLPGDQ